MLGILEYHVDRLVFEDDLSERDDVDMRDLPVQLCIRIQSVYAAPI